MVYSVAARWVSRTAAFAAAAFVVVQLAFAQQMPAITRQEVALLFFGVLVAIAFDDDLPVRYRRLVVLLAGCSLAITHYSTAYVTSLALVGAWLVYGLFRILRRRGGPRRVRRRRVLVGLGGARDPRLHDLLELRRDPFEQQRPAVRGAGRGARPRVPAEQRGSLVRSLRWLQGNAPHRISGEEYAEAGRVDLRRDGALVERVPEAAHGCVPGAERRGARGTVIGAVPAVARSTRTLLIVVSQGLVVVTALGMVAFAWSRATGVGIERTRARAARCS